MAKQNYAFGLQVTDLGLAHIPASAKLHYEHGMFLSLLDQFDSAKKDFDLARTLFPESAIAFIAEAQQSMLAGNIPEAVRAAREGISKGHHDFMLLTLLGEALLGSGIAPGEPAFAEARNALEKCAELAKPAAWAASPCSWPPRTAPEFNTNTGMPGAARLAPDASGVT